MRFRLPQLIVLLLLVWCLLARPGWTDDESAKPAERMSVDRLPEGEFRTAWEAVKQLHPHAQQGRWVVARHAPVNLSDTNLDLREEVYYFTRLCPENGADSLDTAEVWFVRGDAKYKGITGPDTYPKEVLKAPRFTYRQGWWHAATELMSCGCDVGLNQPLASRPVLRIFPEEKGYRLLYEYFPKQSKWAISVDALTGEVGRLEPIVYGLTVPMRDPLEPVRRPVPGHSTERLERGWVKTN